MGESSEFLGEGAIMNREEMEATIQQRFDEGEGRRIFDVLLKSAPSSILEIIMRFIL